MYTPSLINKVKEYSDGKVKGSCEGKTIVELTLERHHFDEDELNVAMLQTMTGMNVTWEYEENSAPLYLRENENF